MVLAAGVMYRPTDIAFDGAGSVYVVEQFNHRVSKWTYDATDTGNEYDFELDVTWGNNNDGTTGEGAPVTGDTDNALDHPSGIVHNGTNLFITDTNHNRIRVIAPANGAFLGSVGTGGFADEDEFYHPAGIAKSADNGSIVIADELNHRAVQYSTATTPVFENVLPDPTLSFVRPHGVIHDDTESLFNVTDSLRSIISNYDEAATGFIAQFGVPRSDGLGNVFLFYPGSGHGLLPNESETVFANTRNNRVRGVEGTTIVEIETGTVPGTGDGKLYWPESVSAFQDTADYILVSNTYNNRIEAFSNGAVSNFQLDFEQNFGSP